MIWFENFSILFFICLSTLIFLVLLLANMLLSPQNIYIEKITSYECGFQTFENYINNFDIKYYMIAVLFLLFDLELIFFLPFFLSLNYSVNIIGIIFFAYFIFILILGFSYEWKTNSLNFLEFNDKNLTQ